MNTNVILLVLASMATFASKAQADSVTGFQVAVATKANGDLEIRATRISNGDEVSYSKWTYGMEQIVFSNCDEKWSCTEDKGSARGQYFAYPKIKGWGYILVRVASGYEEVVLDKVWTVDHEEHKRPISGLKFDCHDLNWSKDGSQLVISNEKESVFFDLNSGGLVTRIPRDDSKLGALLRRNECPG